NWEQIKKEEKRHDSLVEGITPGLPALLYVQKLLRKGSSIGLDADAGLGSVDIAAASADERTLGAALAALVAAGAGHGLGGEAALSAWAGRFRDRFVRMEALAATEGVDLAAAESTTVRELWERAGG